jgi:glutamyl-tRNA synthetase
MKYITRFAPSPTGNPHIGNIRTALFDYLSARATKGKFILRIEDTDRERFVPEAVDYIHQSLEWLNLAYDGEVIFQSDRLKIYQSNVQDLLDKGLAYKCFCTTERLNNLKESQEKAKKAPMYDRKCLSLTKEDVAEKEKNSEPFVVRFKIPASPKKISWVDKVRGGITIATATLDDFIILKSDKWPTYNFAHIIDDHEQEINLVIRGEEFVPSTPKYILLYQALGWEHPEYAHIPLTIGNDHKKLSKRHGDTAILDYKDKGYLPETMINFLALLGWNPGDGSTEEIFSLEELEKIFSVDRIGKSSAVFDLERLDWMNGVWIRKLNVKDLTSRLISFIPRLDKINRAFLERVVTVEQNRLKTLEEFNDISRFYFDLPSYEPDLLVFKKSSLEATRSGLETTLKCLGQVEPVDVDQFNNILAGIVSNNKLNNADVYWPVRVALSGQERSPSPAELLWVFGKDESLKRLSRALDRIKKV